MNEIKVKIETEKKLVIPKLIGFADDNAERCVLDKRFSFACCDGILCKDCICNIDNLIMLADSQNLQLL